MSQSVRDESGNRDQMVTNVVNVIGRSEKKLMFFKTIYDGKKRVKPQEFIREKVNFSSVKQVLTIGKQFVAERIVKQVKDEHNKTAYEKIDFYTHNKNAILSRCKKNIFFSRSNKSTDSYGKVRFRFPAISTQKSKSKRKNNISKKWDVFICHASEDKKSVAKPLVDKLKEEGVDVWYDEFELDWGSHLMQSINYGLKKSLFGIVILSKSFFKKEWAQRELAGLHSLSIANKENKILPLLYQITHDELINYSPLLSDIVYKQWSEGVQTITQSVKRLVNKRKSLARQPDNFSHLSKIRTQG